MIQYKNTVLQVNTEILQDFYETLMRKNIISQEKKLCFICIET